jgi:hypothetical protein
MQVSIRLKLFFIGEPPNIKDEGLRHHFYSFVKQVSGC